ncbi:raffinose invertase-like isoform X3 [Anthonomus grandis grandis]|nr:raffinose invertase-like isoform X3 [Anthonomus grandis grandis]XP_050299327.1 raffinose invertase-like isoform X3 [Anthonomus grandis grandis]XP_050299329.1 raffinose invertase-like isoform X3 [Anthonomus grandis grandis]
MLSNCLILLMVGQAFSIPKTEEVTWYPTYHLAPHKGWINDPNGLIYHNGYYHAFFQHNPENIPEGTKHWGHARSHDMLNWEYLPIALSPSLEDDIDGIFSGSAVNLNGKLTLIYTGVSDNLNKQRQMVAISSDGVNFEKKGVVITKEGDESYFRDPKAWFQNGSWWVVIGSQTTDKLGEVLLYSSKDFFNWTYQGVLAGGNGSLGYMWECPDFFTINGKQILVISPQGLEQDGFNYQNLYQTGYFVGNWQPEQNYTIEKGFREIDHGHDFYASQSFLAPDGRRIQISWLDMWESVFAENVTGWSGMFTIPREISLNEFGDLVSKPIREIIGKRTPNTDIFDTIISSNQMLTLKNNVFSSEILIEFNLLNSSCKAIQLSLKEEPTRDEGVVLYVDIELSRLFMERYYPKYGIDKTNRSVAIDLSLSKLSLDIFVDSSSIEVFVNDGIAVMSSRIYPNNNQRKFSVAPVDGFVNVSLTSYDINVNNQ